MAADRTVELAAELRDLMTAKLKQLENVSKGSFDRMSAAAGKAGDKIEKQKGKVNKLKEGFKKFSDSVVSGLKRFGPTAIVVAGLTKAVLSLGNAMQFVSQSAQDFEQSMSRVLAITRSNEKQINDLSKEAIKLGETTSFSAVEAANAFTELGKKGFDSQQIIASSKPILDLAAASMSDMSQAADVASSTLKGFGLDTSEMQRVTDVMALSFASSALDMEKFQIAMSKIAPVAKAAGFSLEGTVALMGALADAGFEASTIATSTRSILLNMADSSGALAQALGGTVTNVEEMIPALVKLRNQGVNLNDTLQLTDKRSVAAFNRFLEGTNDINKLKDGLDKAKGSADKMAKTMLDNVAGAITILESKQKTLGIALGSTFAEAKRKRIEFYSRTIEFATSMVVEHREGIQGLVNLFSGGFLLAVKGIVRLFQILVGAFETLNTGILSLVQGVAWVISKVQKLRSLIHKDVDAAPMEEFVKNIGIEAEKAAQRALNAFSGKPLTESISKDVDSAKTKIKEIEGPRPTREGPDTSKEDEARQREIQKQIDAAQELEAKLGMLRLTGREKELENNRLKFSKNLEIMIEGHGNIQALTEANRAMVDNINKKWDDKEREAKERKDAEDERFAKREEARMKRLHKQRLQTASTTISAARNIFGAMSSLSQVRANNQIKAAKAAGRSEKEINAIRKKAFEKQKTFQRLQAIGNIALGITNALGRGGIFGLIEGLAITAAGAVQLQTINAQKFAKGGLISKPTVALMGEAGPEGVINNRGLNNIGIGGLNAINSGQNISKSITNEIVYSPNITVQGGSDVGIKEAFMEDKEGFADFFHEVVAKRYIRKEELF